ncbi:DUF4843 domain-containing protein [Solitalea lacus]|uniref:DUF4843 domain-containing protein n=1 Tax=Solitalea lacus TaxID=2911172 RepID=UPI001EDB3171|nr:DUF4843 domain-containing protein [Solitalea lacus]UKJ09275.1 DUF4843 domain-containing protein [Solitalea lacus]
MKFRFQYILAFFSMLSITACEEKPALFTDTDGLYFGTADTAISYSFAKYPKKIADTLQIPVNVLGNSAASDRPIGVEVVAMSELGTAIEGTHFKILSNPVIPANAHKSTIQVAVYRTPDLESGGVKKFAIRLRKDENFPSEGISLKQKLTVNLAYIQKPASWGEYTGTVTGYWAGFSANFGTWTPTKYKLILEALYDPQTGTTVTEFPGNRFGPPVIYSQYLATVRNYIKTKYPGNYGVAGGATLTDPDNSNLPVQVGPANY